MQCRILAALFAATVPWFGMVEAAAQGDELDASLARLEAQDPRFRLIAHSVINGVHELRFFYTTGIGTDHEIMERVNLAIPVDGQRHPRPARGWPMVAQFHGLGGDGSMPSALARADGIAGMGITLQGQGRTFEDLPVPIRGGVYPGDMEKGGKGWFTQIGGLNEQNSVKESISFILENFGVFGIDGKNMGVTGGSYGGIMSWMALSMDLSDVGWKWRTGFVSTFVNSGDGSLYPNFLNGDDDTRFSVRHSYSANTWLKKRDCKPPYGPQGRVLQAEDIDPDTGTIQVAFDDQVVSDDPRLIGQDFVFGGLVAPIVSNTPASVTVRTEHDLGFVKRFYKFPERYAVSSDTAPAPATNSGPWQAHWYRATRDRTDWDNQKQQIAERSVYLPEDVIKTLIIRCLATRSATGSC